MDAPHNPMTQVPSKTRRMLRKIIAPLLSYMLFIIFALLCTALTAYGVTCLAIGPDPDDRTPRCPARTISIAAIVLPVSALVVIGMIVFLRMQIHSARLEIVEEDERRRQRSSEMQMGKRRKQSEDAEPQVHLSKDDRSSSNSNSSSDDTSSMITVDMDGEPSGDYRTFTYVEAPQ